MEITQQCFGDTRPNTPKATERTQAMLSILPVVVSEHLMLKERLRKWEPLTRTHWCGYAKQEKSSLHHSLWPPTCSATPTHSPFPPSSKDIGLPLWNDALKKVENTTYVLSAISSPKRKLLTSEEAGYLTSRTICLESQGYALLWLHDSLPIIFKYSNIYIYIYVCTHTHR